MNSFTISQLQDYSGIKAHTIRIWEQRYNALIPNRSEGNTRSYDGNQLRRLLNIVSLLNTGLKVSKLCILSDVELQDLIEEHYLNKKEQSADSALFSSQLIAAAFDFDEAHFEKVFATCILRLGLRNTYIMVIYPAMERLGLLWIKDALPPANEHFIVNLIRQKLHTAIDALPPAKNKKNSWILFLPENEFHETGLLMSYYLLREAGQQVFYLGANVPTASLKETCDIIKPANLLSFLVAKNDKNADITVFNELGKHLKSSKVYLALSPQYKTTKKQHFHALHAIEDLEILLKK